MERLLKCFKFQLRNMTIKMLIYTCFYVVVYLLICIMFSLANGGASGEFNTNYAYAGVFFIFFSVGVNYKSSLNCLMMFGNTRRNILMANYFSIAIVTAGCAVLSLLSGYANILMSKILHINTSDTLNLIYGNGINDGEKLLWFFALLLLFAGVALVYGTLDYKFGKAFKHVFWGALGLLFVCTSLLSVAGIRSALISGFKFFFGYGSQNGILLCSLNMLIVALVLGGVSYLAGRRQPQNA